MIPCLICGELTRRPRCPAHAAAELDPYRDRAYRRNRAAILTGNPPCALRILCDGARATTADHIVPIAQGGTSAISNLQPACGPCNSSKRGGRR